MLWLGVIGGIVAVAIGAVRATLHAFHHWHETLVEGQDRSGWIYFVGADDTPIKVGMTSHEPTKQRLPELQTMSPKPLSIIWAFWTEDRFVAEEVWHKALDPWRLHGEWFDRDATLATIARVRNRRNPIKARSIATA